jgi:histidine triad (HIT) family protein
MNGVLQVGEAIRTALDPEGTNVITSSGRVAEQTVFHLHIHIVPRWRQDGFGRIWPVEGRYETDDLGDVAALIRDACAGLGQSERTGRAGPGHLR